MAFDVAAAVEQVARAARPFTGGSDQYEALVDAIGGARIVLIGEASHGTHEFYDVRAELTRRLIARKGFTAVAVEADWPDAYRVNRYVRHLDNPGGASQALAGFQRFPTWMWRNTVVEAFVRWLRDRNETEPSATRAGFYGLDLYSLFASLDAVVRYLDDVDPDAARRARSRYACFDHFAEDTQSYGYAAATGFVESCEDAVVDQLLELSRARLDYARRDGQAADDAFFHAEQNARLARNAEHYYRAMFRGRVSSWNLRDSHMMETLEALLAHLERRGPTRIVVWAHNSHLGDARATESRTRGELNLGQLVRERFGKDACLIGLTTHAGTVTAASDWDGAAERKTVRPSLADSVERVCHDTGIAAFHLDLRQPACRQAFARPRLERAIGVIYRPETERLSHYFHVQLAEQFDVLIHLTQTRALEPLEPTAGWHAGEGEAAETYPTGL